MRIPRSFNKLLEVSTAGIQNVSRPISRVLCSIETEWRPFICDICRHMPVATYPGTDADRARCDAACPPIWSCSRWGLPCRRRWPARCALTAPFHPYRYPQNRRRCRRRRRVQAVCFLWHFPWVHTPQALPGTLSCGARTFLRDARRNVTAAAAQPTHGGSVCFAAGRFNRQDRNGLAGTACCA